MVPAQSKFYRLTVFVCSPSFGQKRLATLPDQKSCLTLVDASDCARRWWESVSSKAAHSSRLGVKTWRTRAILMLGNNVSWKLQGNSRLILGKLGINIGVTLYIINFAEVTKKFWKHIFKILMKFVEKCGKLLYKFLSILMEILHYLFLR